MMSLAILIIGSISFIILMAISYDTFLNHREKFPWITFPLEILIAITGVYLVVLTIRWLIRKKR